MEMDEDHKIQSLMGYTRSGSGGNAQEPPMAVEFYIDVTLWIIHSPLVEGPPGTLGGVFGSL